MSRASDDNLGFQGRMSELEHKLKQSEDERLALEDKFNKLLSAKKSEEEMQLYLLRENYSQLLRQDKMRCDRNDMILQTLASVENRASMLTAKTDRLRLLRQHYESYVSRNYPVWNKSVGRHRSVESLISELNENPSQRSSSSSPRLASSYSPSPFMRSPSITRRNSLVVSNSEILDPTSFKPSKVNFTSHSSRRRLFENSPNLERNLNSKSVSPSFSHFSYDSTKDNSLKNETPPCIENSGSHSHAEQLFDGERSPSSLFLQVPTYSDYTNKSLMKEIGEVTKRESERTFPRVRQPLRSNPSRKFEKLSLTGISGSTYLSKPTITKPLTKSSSFSVGSNFSRSVSSYVPTERRSSLIRRPSYVYGSSVSSQPLNRFQSSVSDFSTQPLHENIKSPYSESSPLSERSKFHLSERNKSPLGERGKPSTIIKSKSPLTVVDDIFKKYLINYDKRYLSDPISESKYGKYLYPLSHYDYTNSKDQKIKQFSNVPEPKYYDNRSSYFDDDVSISSRESVVPNLYRTYGSHDSLHTNDHQDIFHERNTPFFDDKKDWKEWNHYKTRYEYPPTTGFGRLQAKPSYVDDLYYPTDENTHNEISKTTKYDFPNDFSEKYSDYLNVHDESDKYLTSETDLGVLNKDNIKPYEKTVSVRTNLTSKDTFKTPQTPKKVSFSNECLYDDKSDTEISSNIDEIISSPDRMKDSDIKHDSVEASPLGKITLKIPEQDYINLSKETEQNESNDDESKLGTRFNEKESANKISKIENRSDSKYVTKEDSLKLNEKDSENSQESRDTGKDSFVQSDNMNLKPLEFPAITEEAGKNIISQNDSSYPIMKEKDNEQTALFTETISKDYSLLNDNIEEDKAHSKEGGQLSAKNLEDIGKESTTKEQQDDNEKGSVEIRNISPSLDNYAALNAENTGENAEIQSGQNETELGKENIDEGKEIKSDSIVEHDSTLLTYGSSENLPSKEAANFETYDTTQKGGDTGYSEDQQVEYTRNPVEEREIYDDQTAQQYNDPNIYTNPDAPEYGNDYNREQYDQPQQQYDQQLEGYVNEEYVQNDVPRYDNNEDVYGSEHYEQKDYQQPEIYPSNQYDQPNLDYEKDNSSHQDVQDYEQPLPQEQYESDQYVAQDQYQQEYKEGDPSQYPIEYPPENIPQEYVADQSYKGEYAPEYEQQQYDSNYQDPSQVTQNAPEQYDAAYQGDPQYGYDQGGSTYDEQYEQQGPQYDQQQPPFDQYEQQQHYSEQYQAAPDQYGNYDYTYDQTAPVAEQPYPGDEQNYLEETKPYDYNDTSQQPYDNAVQQPYSDNVQYEEMQQSYPDEQNVYRDEQGLYETADYPPQNLDVSQHENIPSDYDYPLQTQSSQPISNQLTSQQDEPLYEPEPNLYPEADLSSREAVPDDSGPKLNQILESDPESTIAQPVSQEDSSDFSIGTGQK